jgi:hypothetical protein
MSVRNFDSSNLTLRKQSKALGAFATAVNAAINNNAGVQTVRTTQPNTQMSRFVTQQNQGVCFCATDRLANPYPFNPSGGACGCGPTQ